MTVQSPTTGGVRRGSVPPDRCRRWLASASAVLSTAAGRTDLDGRLARARRRAAGPGLGSLPRLHDRQPLQGRGHPRRRRHGRRLPCRHKIIDKQVALKILRADLARDAGDHRALPEGGQGRLGDPGPAHHRHQRLRPAAGRRHLLRDGVPRGHAARADGGRRQPDAARAHPAHRAADRRGPRAPRTSRDRPPRSQARQRLPDPARHRGRLRQDPRLRHRQGIEQRRRPPARRRARCSARRTTCRPSRRRARRSITAATSTRSA